MKKVYTTSDFNYELPSALIAKYPLSQRSQSRLLVVDRQSGQITHRQFIDLIEFLHPNDLVVFNDTKVIPARLHGVKGSGGKIECLVERVLSSNSVLAHVRASKAPKPGSELVFSDIRVEVLGREDDLFKLKFLTEESIFSVLDRLGEMPIPPYIDRSEESLDKERYQTVFAEKAGAVAAPTASLHFDQPMLNALAEQGIETAMLTLHVGAGTFLPMRTENLQEHIMHKEYVDVPVEVCDKIDRARARGGRIVAIGTTVVRSLETAAQDGVIRPYQGDTQLFITPGYTFQLVDVLFTNFHLPKSTLLMLVSAFGGYDLIRQAYQQAIDYKYRFFSYGDAMLIY